MISKKPENKFYWDKMVWRFRDQGEDGYVIKSVDGAKTWAKTDGQINGIKYLGKFAFGKNGEVYVTVSQETPNGAASSVYSSNDEGKTWLLEGTNKQQKTNT